MGAAPRTSGRRASSRGSCQAGETSWIASGSPSGSETPLGRLRLGKPTRLNGACSDASPVVSRPARRRWRSAAAARRPCARPRAHAPRECAAADAGRAGRHPRQQAADFDRTPAAAACASPGTASSSCQCAAAASVCMITCCTARIRSSGSPSDTSSTRAPAASNWAAHSAQVFAHARRRVLRAPRAPAPAAARPARAPGPAPAAVGWPSAGSAGIMARHRRQEQRRNPRHCGPGRRHGQGSTPAGRRRVC